eukprot:2240705-Karenia_brevis.AAC.1
MDARRGFIYNSEAIGQGRIDVSNLQAWSDGGCRARDGISSYAWLVKAWTGSLHPVIIAAGSVFLDRPARSSLEVEAL